MREKCTLRPKMTTKYASETNLVLNKSQNGNQVGKVNKLSIS